MKKVLFAALLGFCLQYSAYATPSGAGNAPGCEGLKVATGPVGKGYSKMFADVVKVCGDQVSLCEVPTGGGLDNLNSMAVKEAQVGFVQLDTYAGMKGGDENVSSLQAVAGMNYNYLHVVALANGFKVQGEKKWGLLKGDVTTVTIQRFSDLANTRVALVGSAQLLGRTLNTQLRFKMQIIDVESDAKAFEMVRTGAVAAAMSVSGWPSGPVSGLPASSGLTLIPFDAPIQAPYVVRPVSYKNLGVYNNNLLAVPNVLLTRPFTGDAAMQVSKLKACLAEKLVDLKEGSYQPGWNEIKSLDTTYDIPKFVGKPAGNTVVAPKSSKR